MLAPRGLHTLPFLSSDGHPFIVAVSGAHRLVAWVELIPAIDPGEATAYLERRLAAADPLTPPTMRKAAKRAGSSRRARAA